MEIRRLLQEAVKQLPTRQREVFLLRHFESLQFGQIASITGVSDVRLRPAITTHEKKSRTF